jgi:hypothetical protein
MKTNNKIYIILSIFILISLFLIIFFIWPLILEIKKNSTDLIVAKDSLANLGMQIEQMNNFKKKYTEYKPNLEKIDQLFVDPSNPVDFIEFLEKEASSVKITSQISLTSNPRAPLNSEQFINLQFTSEGIFSNVMRFIKKIESGPYLIEIEKLIIQDSKKNAQTKIITEYTARNVEAVITIKVFTKK